MMIFLTGFAITIFGALGLWATGLWAAPLLLWALVLGNAFALYGITLVYVAADLWVRRPAYPRLPTYPLAPADLANLFRVRTLSTCAAPGAGRVVDTRTPAQRNADYLAVEAAWRAQQAARYTRADLAALYGPRPRRVNRPTDEQRSTGEAWTARQPVPPTYKSDAPF